MGIREELLKRIERKNEEIKELELKIREANSYIQGLQDVLNILPREGSGAKKKFVALRPNTDVGRAREFLEKVSMPTHIGAILEGTGKGDTKANRLSLTGSLGEYVRKGEIFTRPAPNTFGLVEFDSESSSGFEEEANAQVINKGRTVEPPEGFGLSYNESLQEETDDDPFGD